MRRDLNNDDTESTWIELRINSKRILCATYYRPPLSTSQNASHIDAFVDSFRQSLNNASAERPDCIIILGDFNDRCTEWISDHRHSEFGTKLLDLLRAYSFHQLVNEPTRITERSANILDLIITDSPGFISNVEVLAPVANLDHSPILCDLSITYTNEK